MTLSLEFWLRKRSKDYWTRQNARQDLRWRLAKQLRDESKRGKGNRASLIFAARTSGTIIKIPAWPRMPTLAKFTSKHGSMTTIDPTNHLQTKDAL